MIDVEMARRTRPLEKQIHPTGERWTVDDKWKDRVRQELVARGWSQADLAAKIGVVPASITNLLKPGISQSRLVLRVQKVFGWVDATGPVVAVETDDALRRLHRNWPKLTDLERENFTALIEALAAKR